MSSIIMRSHTTRRLFTPRLAPLIMSVLEPTFTVQKPPATFSFHISAVTRQSSSRKSILQQIPPKSWDSHMHVVDLEYPLSSPAYKPHAASLSDALTAESSLGISNLVFVQPSIYGNDNSCLLEAMESLGPQHARGVVAFDPATISKDELHRWHHIGVRGVRVNLMSTGKTPSSKELSDLLWAYAEVIRPLDWVLQLYLDMENLPSLEDTIPNLGVKVCLDHFASPWIPPNSKSRAPIDPYDLEGFDSLMSLLRQGNTYVKFSAAYRLSPDPNSKDVEAIAREILRVAHGRAVFATDWPHTRFDGLDIAPYVQQCLDWCDGNSKRVERVFRKNAEELWDVQS